MNLKYCVIFFKLILVVCIWKLLKVNDIRCFIFEIIKDVELSLKY